MTELPKGWAKSTLGELVDAIREQSKIENTKTYELWSIPSFSDGAPEIIQGSEIGSSKLKVIQDDILISKINPRINRVWLVEDSNLEQLASPEWLVARIKDSNEIDKKFLQFYLSSPEFRDWISRAASSVTGSHSRAKANEILQRDIPLPPIGEQHKIVELLEDHLSRLDAALVDVKLAKLKAAQFRRSLLLSLMSPDYAGSSGDWTRTTLGNVCDLVAGKTPPSLESSIVGIDNSSRTVPFYKVGDMNLHPEYLCESRLYLSAKQVEDRKLFILPEGSVVFPKAGGAIATNKKRIILVPGPIDLNCMAAIPIHGTNPKYLSWWFQSINLSTFADGSILPQLSKGKMSEILVDWPNLKLQEEIVLILEKSLSKNSEGIKLAEAVEANSSSLRRSLLQAAFTGQLTKEVVSV